MTPLAYRIAPGTWPVGTGHRPPRRPPQQRPNRPRTGLRLRWTQTEEGLVGRWSVDS
jgi:hypothetical protein